MGVTQVQALLTSPSAVLINSEINTHSVIGVQCWRINSENSVRDVLTFIKNQSLSIWAIMNRLLLTTMFS